MPMQFRFRRACRQWPQCSLCCTSCMVSRSGCCHLRCHTRALPLFACSCQLSASAEGAFWLAAKWLLIWVVFFQLIFMILPEIFYSKKKLIIGGTRTEYVRFGLVCRCSCRAVCRISKPSHYIAAFVAEPVAGGEVCGCIAIQVWLPVRVALVAWS